MIEKHNELLENEWYHVRHSGEIPEVALHSSIHFLTEDNNGPMLSLQEKDRQFLHEAAMQRYRDIILRDILPENRDATIYRGVLRAICNWRRSKRFCSRHNLHPDLIKDEVKSRFLTFIHTEVADVTSGRRTSSINCSFEDLFSFAIELDVDVSDVSEQLEEMCPSL